MNDEKIREIADVIDDMVEDNAHIRETRWDGYVAIANSEEIASELLKHYQIVDKNSVVISREEYERLSSSHDIVFCDNKDCSDNLLCRCCEISGCPKNIPEYNEKLSANKHKLELFQKLCKERERANGWEDRYELLEEELKQEREENKRLFYRNSNLILENKNLKENTEGYERGSRETAEKCIQLIKETYFTKEALCEFIAKQFGVK